MKWIYPRIIQKRKRKALSLWESKLIITAHSPAAKLVKYDGFYTSVNTTKKYVVHVFEELIILIDQKSNSIVRHSRRTLYYLWRLKCI
jgi:hypothetical protein